MNNRASDLPQADSPQAWRRLWITLALMTIGSAGMYVVSVVLPAVQAEFGATRAQAALPYTLQMIGFGLGCLLAGRLSDRFGLVPVVRMGAVCLGLGFMLSGLAGSLWLFAIVQGVLVGLLGAATSFVPLVADTALWFVRRRGIAVAVCASGNYVAGALWPPVVQHAVQALGWRHTYMALGVFSLLTMLALSRGLRGASPAAQATAVGAGSPGQAGGTTGPVRPFGLAPGVALALLCVAGTACCVAMAMPQVHIVAYCGDLGYGVARGAEMLSLMLGCGIVSRLVSGAICDRIGGVRTLLLGSFLQGVALLLFLPFDGLVSLYLVSALFGLFQGGIVPSYAIIVREHFPVAGAATTTGWIIMFTLFGMALGGWMSGKVFDLTGSYHAAFLNGIAWNALNFSVALFLYWRASGRAGSGGGRALPAAA
ncbi:MFS transporter [Ideonella sp. DXS22W]|uniref:MFS transporter n=1 Tax=Pseudaquabacterium inlustre TaxID=2984192 RepID=A0ABU9CIC3_9BURK